MDEKKKIFQRFDLAESQRGFLDRLFYEMRDFDDFDLLLEEVVKILKNHRGHYKNIRKGINDISNLVNAAVSDLEFIETQPEQFLSKAKLSKILNVSKGAVTGWVKKGYLKETAKGNAVEIAYSDVDKFVQIYKKYKNAWERFKELNT